ncbi:MAG: hypothetical protein ACLFPL_01360 [Candidatus Nanoarchaeia archaeon]
MKSSALQQQLYEYRDATMSQLKEEFDKNLELYREECSKSVFEFEEVMKKKFELDIEHYKQQRISSAKKQAKNIIQTAQQEEISRVVEKVCKSIESRFLETVKVFMSRASQILNVEEKELQLTISSMLSQSIISQLKKTFVKNSVETSSMIQKYEIVCRKEHLIVRCNIKDELYSIISEDVQGSLQVSN